MRLRLEPWQERIIGEYLNSDGRVCIQYPRRNGRTLISNFIRNVLGGWSTVDAEETVFIVADNLRDASEYARRNNLGREGLGWRFAHELLHVQGRRGGKYAYVSRGFESTSQWIKNREIVAALRNQGFTDLEATE